MSVAGSRPRRDTSSVGGSTRWPRSGCGIRVRWSSPRQSFERHTPAGSPGWEVPVAAGDARAADLLLVGATEILHIEIERALVDFQAQLRSAQLKRDELSRREERQIRLIIAVPDTRASRERLAPFDEVIGRTLSRTSRPIWAAIRNAEPLGGDGILFVRGARQG